MILTERRISRAGFAQRVLSPIVGHEVTEHHLLRWERKGHLPPYGEGDAREYIARSIHLASTNGEGIPPSIAAHTFTEEQEEAPMIDNALLEIDRLAHERCQRDPKVRFVDAMTQVLGERPDLYYRYTRAMASAKQRRTMMEGAAGKLTCNELRDMVDSAMSFAESRTDPRTKPPDTSGLPGWHEIDAAADEGMRGDPSASFLGLLSLLQTSHRAAWRQFEFEFHALSVGPDSAAEIERAIKSMKRPNDWRRALGIAQLGDAPKTATEREPGRYFIAP